MTNKNAYQGDQVERLFKDSLPHQPQAVAILKQAIGIHPNGVIAKTYKTGADAGKSDVIIRFTTGETLAATIKSYKNDTMGFNQAMRMNPYKFIDTVQLSAVSGQFLLDSIIEKAKDKQRPFITTELNSSASYFIEEIKEKALDSITYSICGKEWPELFVLWCRGTGRMSIYLMQTIVMQLRSCMDITLTKRGIIRFNSYFTLQRKGGNGVKHKRDKIDIMHGGNNVQIKINTAKFNREIAPLCCYYIT